MHTALLGLSAEGVLTVKGEPGRELLAGMFREIMKVYLGSFLGSRGY
jgi:hypothetical protein